jgi:hypothetical protein
MKMIALLIAQAGASESPINAENVPGVVGIPTAERETKFTESLKDLDESHDKAIKDLGESHAKAIEAKVTEHRDAFQDQAKFWQKQLENREKELGNLGEKLDARHDESIGHMQEVGKALRVVDLMMEQIKSQGSN